MKRLTAFRKLKRPCICCNRTFKKGEIYYLKRTVFEEDREVFANECLICPKCKYKQEQQVIRFKIFKPKCQHKIRYDVWSYIPGEAVMEPNHTECLVCGKWL